MASCRSLHTVAIMNNSNKVINHMDSSLLAYDKMHVSRV